MEDEVLRVHSILHLIFHRNKNQHGRAMWWKWLSILKRTVWNLAQSLSFRDPGTLRLAEFYTKYLADRVIPRCYVAFSVVVADVQFSPIGTVLVATLARLAKATGVDKDLKTRRRRTETAQKSISLPLNDFVSHRDALLEAREDIGQALSRGDEEEVLDVPQDSEPQQQTPQLVLEADSGLVAKDPDAEKTRKKKKKKKKKTKKKNAIDDLFDRLL
ncbi:hypothetical protein BJX64DRAFT_272038 [Aspergillus heterothallicus]